MHWFGQRALQRSPLLLLALALLLLAGGACAGGSSGAAVGPAPQQPAPSAQPVPAAPAADPRSPTAPSQLQAPAAAAAPKPAAPAAAAPKYGGIAVFANRGDPPLAWDSMRTDTLTLHRVYMSVTGAGNFIKPCRENIYEVCTALAERWEPNADFTQWTFKIRDDALWHDGKPFTAEDAKFWVDLSVQGAAAQGKTRAPSMYKSEFGAVQKVEALSGNRLRITLERAAVEYPRAIGRAFLTVAHPPHLMKPLIEKGEVSVGPQDVGFVATGPFKVVKNDKGSLIQVRRFDRYYEKDEAGRTLPFMDGMDFPIIRDPSAMDAAFRVGRLDSGGYGSGPYLSKERQVGYIRDLGDRVWFTDIGGARSALGFNTLKPGPFQDLRVRRAMALWLDKQAYIDGPAGGFGYFASLMHPKNPYSNADFMSWPGWNPQTRDKDRAEAKRLMAEAGYPNGFQTELPCRRILVAECEYHEGQLRGLGIIAKIILLDEAQFIANARLSLDYPVVSGGVAAYATIPEGAEAEMAAFSVTKLSVGKHEDPKVGEFFAKIKANPNREQRIKTWQELVRYYLLEQVYVVPTPGNSSVVPYRSYVKGVPVPIEDVYNNLDYATTWLDK